MFTQAASRFLTIRWAIFRASAIELQVTSTTRNCFARAMTIVSCSIVHEAFSLRDFACEQKANTGMEETVDAWTLPEQKVVSARRLMTQNS
jgi:hypothetical protein